MKRITLVTFVLVLLWAGSAFAAGKVTTTPEQIAGGIPVGAAIYSHTTSYCMTFTADDTDFSFEPATITMDGGSLVDIYINPGATAPTSTTDIKVLATATGFGSIDILDGAGESAVFSADDIIRLSPPASFTGPLSVTLTGNSVASASAGVCLVFR